MDRRGLTLVPYKGKLVWIKWEGTNYDFSNPEPVSYVEMDGNHAFFTSLPTHSYIHFTPLRPCPGLTVFFGPKNTPLKESIAVLNESNWLDLYGWSPESLKRDGLIKEKVA